MSRRLMVFNLRTDADHALLGFTTEWLNALAQYYDGIDVISTHTGRLAVAPNVRVYSVGREQGAGRGRAFVAFYARLLRLLVSHRYVACFAHMQPLFAVLAGVVLWAFGIRQTLWYTHKQRTRTLAWAVRLSWRVVSADVTSFPIATPKLRVLGHGINADFYAPDDSAPVSPPRIVYVARLMPIKRHDLLLRALTSLPSAHVLLVGDVPSGEDVGYKQYLHALAQELGLSERVHFAGTLTPEGVRDAYRTATLAVNLSPVGLFDKAALEAMACAVPTVTLNPAFAPVMGDFAPRLLADEATLADVIARLLATPAPERAMMGRALREGVQAQHSLPTLITRLKQVLETGEMG
jgi:glycosyltransferase involved in cell wall biosynthesis